MVTKVMVMGTIAECDDCLRRFAKIEPVPFQVSHTYMQAVRDTPDGSERIVVVPVGDVVRRISGMEYRTFEFVGTSYGHKDYFEAKRWLEQHMR